MPENKPKLKVLDLFSGIQVGGFSLGLERTGGFETVAFCEIEEFPRKVLAKHWPEVPCYEDVRKLRAEDVGTVDVVCGGYPCQPFSTAGKRRGKEDNRHLWPEFNRLVAELRPTWVIGENVAGHISMGLDDVLFDLEGQGYACRTFVIPACAVDAPHRRDRCWTVANRDDLLHARKLDPGANRTTPSGSEGFDNREGEASHGKWVWFEPSASGADVSDTDRVYAQREQPCFIDAEEWRKSRKRQVGSQNSKSGRQWLTEPDVGRVADGVPNRVDRLKGLGNAVVPQIPEMIGHAILQAGATS